MARANTAVIILNLLIHILANFKFNTAIELKLTNLQCDVVDPSFLTYRLCRLKVIRRGVIALNVDVELHKKAISCVVKVQLFKKANGYKPFLLNRDYDFCDLQSKRKFNVLTKIVNNFISEFTNANHTCPYEHNIIVKDLILTEDKFKLVPLPSGEYMIKFGYVANGELRTEVNAFFSRIE